MSAKERDFKIEIRTLPKGDSDSFGFKDGEYTHTIHVYEGRNGDYMYDQEDQESYIEWVFKTIGYMTKYNMKFYWPMEGFGLVRADDYVTDEKLAKHLTKFGYNSVVCTDPPTSPCGNLIIDKPATSSGKSSSAIKSKDMSKKELIKEMLKKSGVGVEDSILDTMIADLEDDGITEPSEVIPLITTFLDAAKGAGVTTESTPTKTKPKSKSTTKSTKPSSDKSGSDDRKKTVKALNVFTGKKVDVVYDDIKWIKTGDVIKSHGPNEDDELVRGEDKDGNIYEGVGRVEYGKVTKVVGISIKGGKAKEEYEAEIKKSKSKEDDYAKMLLESVDKIGEAWLKETYKKNPQKIIDIIGLDKLLDGLGYEAVMEHFC